MAAETFEVTNREGKVVQLRVYTAAELPGFVDRKQRDHKKIQDSVAYMKNLGLKVSELAPLDEKARVAYILERYKELGVGQTNGKKSAAATATGKGKPAAAAAATKTKGAAKAAVTPPPADDDDEDDEDEDAGTAEAASEEEESEASADYAELEAKFDDLQEKFGEMARFVLDTHALVRQIAIATTGFSEAELSEVAKDTFATLVVEVPEGEDEGNDD